MRRIQEVVGEDVTPAGAFMAGGGAGGGDPQLEALAETIALETLEASSGTPLDTTTAPIALEQGQLNQAQALVGGGGPPGGGDTGPSREYVWGPGDGGGGLDELLVQFDDARVALYILQDAGGDIVAAAQRSQFEFWTTVASQYTFDAYGCVQTAEVFAPHAPLHAGHKGLFFDRLDDNAPFDPSAGEAPSLIPFTQHLYHVRNRSYCPQLGRWMQRDPNATAMTLLNESIHHGVGVAALVVAAIAPDEVYGDGHNLYQYLDGAPTLRSDPMGLDLQGWGQGGGLVLIENGEVYGLYEDSNKPLRPNVRRAAMSFFRSPDFFAAIGKMVGGVYAAWKLEEAPAQRRALVQRAILKYGTEMVMSLGIDVLVQKSRLLPGGMARRGLRVFAQVGLGAVMTKIFGGQMSITDVAGQAMQSVGIEVLSELQNRAERLIMAGRRVGHLASMAAFGIAAGAGAYSAVVETAADSIYWW